MNIWWWFSSQPLQETVYNFYSNFIVKIYNFIQWFSLRFLRCFWINSFQLPCNPIARSLNLYRGIFIDQRRQGLLPRLTPKSDWIGIKRRGRFIYKLKLQRERNSPSPKHGWFFIWLQIRIMIAFLCDFYLIQGRYLADTNCNW